MYPEGHPYRYGILGRHEDLEAATLRDVQTFFATFYVPNNVTLAIAGDFDPEPTKALVRSLFGSIPRGAPVPRREVPASSLDRVVRKTILDRVELPRIKMAWHGPARFAEGDAEMQMLGELLSDGKSSRLYRRLVVEDRLAVDVAAYQDAFDLDSLFQIDVTVASGADLDAVERAIDDELAKVREDGVTDIELEPRKSAHELHQLAGLQSAGAIAAQLVVYEAAFGDPDSFARDLERIRAVTPASVKTWADRVLDPETRGILRVLPVAPARTASARDDRPAPTAAKDFTPRCRRRSR